jgi:hypothetical protein
MHPIIALLAICLVSSPLFAQTPSPEQQIRDQIIKFDTAPEVEVSAMFDKDVVVWTGAYAKPQTPSVPTDPADLLASPGRKNVVQKTSVQRIVVSKSGDMAYEYSTHTLSFDDDRGHQEPKGALLRVWRRTEAEWKIAAWFQRSYGRVVPVDAPAK